MTSEHCGNSNWQEQKCDWSSVIYDFMKERFGSLWNLSSICFV